MRNVEPTYSKTCAGRYSDFALRIRYSQAHPSIHTYFDPPLKMHFRENMGETMHRGMRTASQKVYISFDVDGLSHFLSG